MKPIPGLHDIQGLDFIGGWPLAIGWWILFGLIAALLAIAALMSIRRELKRRSWQYQVLKELELMEKNLSAENSQAIALALSALLRRLAIQRFSRQQCASLEGEAWLSFLTVHDPAHYNWSHSARYLIEAPFSPEVMRPHSLPLLPTIHAAKGWVK